MQEQQQPAIKNFDTFMNQSEMTGGLNSTVKSQLNNRFITPMSNYMVDNINNS